MPDYTVHQTSKATCALVTFFGPLQPPHIWAEFSHNAFRRVAGLLRIFDTISGVWQH